MSFIQRIRLPFYTTQPVWPLEQSVFRLANGSLKNQSSIVRKVYKIKTDWMPERWHESFRIALAHDYITIESNKFVGRVAMEGTAYEPEYNDFLDYPLAKAETTVQVDSFDFSNSNCVTCEQVGQLDLTDDNFGSVSEGGSGSGNVFSNDSIFCDPVTASIVTYDSVYLAAAPTINDTGAVTFILNTPLPDVTSAKIFTYRVTCADGSYDDADVYIDIDGSLEGCSPPDNVRDASPPTHNSHQVIWDDNGSPADGWYWEVYDGNNYGVQVASGSVPAGDNLTGAIMTGLQPCTNYRIFVRSRCAGGTNESAFTDITFSTDCLESTCGQFEVGYNDGTAERNSVNFTFMACNGTYRTLPITNTQTRLVCMLQSEPGVPVDLTGPLSTIDYIGPC